MKLNKAKLLVWPASLGAGFSLSYSVVGHWFVFLYASTINRLEMLLVLGAIFSIFGWLFLKKGWGYFVEEISWRRFYVYLGVAVLISGAAVLFVLPILQKSLIPPQAQLGSTLTTIMRVLWTRLRLADFVSLAVVLLVGETVVTLVANHWGSITRAAHRITSISPTLGIVLFFCLLANLYISKTDKAGTLHLLKPLSSNSLVSVVWSQDYMKQARAITLLFEYYQGWTLIAPGDLLDKLNINSPSKLVRWGRIGSVVIANYPTDLSSQEEKDLLAQKKVKIDNGSGLHYYAILAVDSTRNICLRTYKDYVFIVPVSLSPICENR